MDYRHELGINIVSSVIHVFFLFMLLLIGIVGYSTRNKTAMGLLTLFYVYIYFNVEFGKKRDYESTPFKMLMILVMCVMFVPLKELYGRADYFRRFGVEYSC